MNRCVGIVLATAWLLAGCSGDDTDGALPSSVPDAASDATRPVSAGSDAGVNSCADAGFPPSTLECTGLYADFATKEIAPSAWAYTPATPLWSDGAQKSRWIELPPNTQIDISDPSSWQFPVGTKLFKEFRVDGQRVETRFFQKSTPNFWVYATYAWSPDGTSAPINYGGPVPVGEDGGTWTIPTNDACNECHSGRPGRILGFEQVSLGLPLAQGLTLEVLAEQGLVTPAPTTTSLSIGDDGTGLDALAMGWLHVNCGVTCHNSNPGSAAYGAGMRLRLDPTQLDGTPPNATTWDILKTTLNVPCVSGFNGQSRIIPGDPTDSILYQLINERGGIQMPPIGSAVVDTPDVTVVGDWITALGSLPPEDGGTGDGGQDAGPPFDAGGFTHDGGGHHDGGGKPEDAGNDAGESDAGSDATTSDDGGSNDDGASDASADDATAG